MSSPYATAAMLAARYMTPPPTPPDPEPWYWKGVYVGPRTDLRGEEAMVRPKEQCPDGDVVAQFDNMGLAEAFGWHRFPAADFKEMA